MKLTVVSPTLNESKNLPRLIRELEKVFVGYEIIIVDDDCPDHTWKLAEEIAQHDPMSGYFLLRRADCLRVRDSMNGNASKYCLRSPPICPTLACARFRTRLEAGLPGKQSFPGELSTAISHNCGGWHVPERYKAKPNHK